MQNHARQVADRDNVKVFVAHASVSAEALIAGKRIAPPPPPLRRCGPVVEQIGIKRSASPRLASLVGPAEDLKREVGKTSGRGDRVPQSEKERLQLPRRIAGLSSCQSVPLNHSPF